MKYILVIMFSWACLVSYAQPESGDEKAASKNFMTLYNEGKFDKLYESLSPDFQKNMPADQAKAFLDQLKQQSGMIKSMTFLNRENNFANYKTVFEKITWSILLGAGSGSKINYIQFKPFKENNTVTPTRNVTALVLPFDAEWTVLWGGDTKELNYHVASTAQKNAFDFVVRDQSGKTHKTNGRENEDYYAFGKELMAAADAEVVLVVDGVRDNQPGTMNPAFVTGNTVVLKTARNEFIYYAHFKQHSIVVKQGDIVKTGQKLGLCGNSGNSSEPHLHFHIQDSDDLIDGTGIKSYFSQLVVNGKSASDYSPVQNDKVSNPATINKSSNTKNTTAMKLGAFSISLSVKDINVSKTFYENLGFTVFAGSLAQKYLIMKNEATLIGIFQGMFEGNMLTFNPGWDTDAKNVDIFDDIRSIQKHIKTKGIAVNPEADEKTKGPASFIVKDPDGNVILFDQHR